MAMKHKTEGKFNRKYNFLKTNQNFDFISG